MSDQKESLEDRIRQFNTLSLPGQPMMMHMGTSYLVDDLWRKVAELKAEVARLTEALRVEHETAVEMSGLDLSEHITEHIGCSVCAILVKAEEEPR